MADRVLIPQPHGGALLAGGPGRPPSRAVQAIREARSDLMQSLDALRAIRDAGKCDKCGRGASTPDEIIKAAVGLIRLSMIDKARPRKRKRSTFNVRTTGAQAAQLPDDATNASAEPATNAPARDPEPESGAGAPR